MNHLWSTLLTATLLASASTTISHAQGTVTFNTLVPGLVDAPVSLGDHRAPGVGDSWSAGLWLVAPGGALTPIPASFTTFRSVPPGANPLLAKYVNTVSTVEIPGTAPGGSAVLRMRAWETRAGSYEAALWGAQSADFVVSGLGGGPTPPANLIGLQGFIVPIPEPRLIPIAALGVAMFWLHRRKKPCSRFIKLSTHAPLNLLCFSVLCLSASAQGTVTFNTRVPGMVDAPVSLCDLNGPGPGQTWTAGLFIVNSGENLTPIPASFTTFRSVPLNGNSLLAKYVNTISTVEIPGVPIGGTVNLRMRAWETSAGSYEAATGIDSTRIAPQRAESSNFTVSGLGGGPTPPANLVGLPGFVASFAAPCAPEPAALTLAALGGVLFLLRPRSKLSKALR
jgi:hypothetical protein